MLTTELMWGIAGLAVLDSLNPATVAGVTLILLAPLRRRGLTALAYVAGAYVVVLAVGTALFLGGGELADTVTGASTWVRRGALLLAALFLVVGAARRLRTRVRPAVVLPAGFGPWTAAPLGVLVTGADLPNAFPYLVAVERLVAADVASATGVGVLALYAVVYCLPCLALLVVGLAGGGRVADRLRRVYDRLGGARVQHRSVAAAVGLLVLGLGVATLAVAL